MSSGRRMNTRRLIIAGAVAGLLAGRMNSADGQQAVRALCSVNIESPRLVLKGAERHARAEYVIPEDCEPVLKAVTYSPGAPATSAAPRAAADPAVPSDSVRELSRPSSVSGAATGQACTLDVWEVDVAEVAMITVRNFTTWQTVGGEIDSARAEPHAFANLDWWFLDDKPSAQIAYLKEPYTARSQARSSFYCDGARGLAKYVCPGPSYRIRLEADILFDGGGTCSGNGRAAGTTVPFGRIRFDLTRGG